MKLSVIIPVFNGERTIAQLINSLFIDLSGIEFEVIMVNDGSEDTTDRVCEKITSTRSNVKFISLGKNYGEHSAVLCGLNFCVGEYAVIIDDDFQNPPTEILKLLHEIEKGYDVVYSKYHKPQQSLFRRICSNLNNRVANILLNKPNDLYLSSFKIIKREIVADIIKYKGLSPYIDGLVVQTTGNIGSIYVKHLPRLSGKSGYTLQKLLRLHLNMILSSTIKPLRMLMVIGPFFFIATITLLILDTMSKMHWAPAVYGSTTLIITAIMLAIAQIMLVSMVIEYIRKNYINQSHMQQWSIKKTVQLVP